MKKNTFVMNCKEGFHLRPAQVLVERITPLQSHIEIKKKDSDEKADAKSLLGLMSLGVATGEEVEVFVDGPDEEQAMALIENLFKTNFDE
jgi:phosphocarrier protein HPr